MGFEGVWLAEHHGTAYGSMPSPQIAAAAIARRTTTMTIGVAVTILPFAHPVRIAEDWAMVDVISGGRLHLGVGRGYQPGEFKNLGIPHLQAVSRDVFAEELDIILGLWTNETFSYKGKYYELEDVRITPKPLQRPHPPLYVAAISPETFTLVSDLGLNMLVTPTLMALPELTDFTVDAKRRLVEGGRDALSLNFPMNWQIHLADSKETAKKRTKEAFDWYFDAVMKLVPKGPNAPKTYDRYAALAAEVESAGGLTVEALEEMGVVLLGTPDDAIERIEQLRDEMGLQELLCWMRVGGLDHESVMDSIRLFGENVIPELKSREALVPKALREQPAVA
jgi:alkanesulfonate monooxygenase SsuD/methylene tetrahydromethanopterin reductase-like flavin-dependent oxidoreductase (luciferase family)